MANQWSVVAKINAGADENIVSPNSGLIPLVICYEAKPVKQGVTVYTNTSQLATVANWWMQKAFPAQQWLKPQVNMQSRHESWEPHNQIQNANLSLVPLHLTFVLNAMAPHSCDRSGLEYLCNALINKLAIVHSWIKQIMHVLQAIKHTTLFVHFTCM